MISVSNLIKTYNDGTKAIDDISFSVNEGEFFGFLGPNGAGKTTTIKILTTSSQKTKGTIKINGYDLEIHPKKIRQIIGVQPQESAIDDELTGKENLELIGSFFGLNKNEVKKRTIDILEELGLTEYSDKRAYYYSGGMKKRLNLAASLIHKPKLLFLDEPTTGLDPQSRTTVWNYLKRINDEGTTIFLTTQYMEEADHLCERLAIIDLGKIVVNATPKKLKNEIGSDVITMSFKNMNNTSVETLSSNLLKKTKGVTNVTISDGQVIVYGKDGSQLVPKLVRLLDDAKLPLSSLTLKGPSLDDVFFKYTGRRIRVEELKKPVGGRFGFQNRRRR
mgnify:CR=1 FL=1